MHQAHIWTDRPSNGLFNEYWPQGVARPKDTPAVPSTLDWDLWLGPAPSRPYNPAYLPFKWRGWWDFGTGALGDIGCHSMDPVFRALKLSAPLSVQASSTRVNEETFPLGSIITYQFPARYANPQANNYHVHELTGAAAGAVEMPPCKLIWYDGGLRPPRPEGSARRSQNGRQWAALGRGQRFHPQRCDLPGVVRQGFPGFAAHHPAFGGPLPGVDPRRQGRQTRPGSNFDWAGPLAESVLLGNVALRVQLREELTLYRLLWDSENLKFTNLEDANKFVRGDYRAGWSL